MRIIFLGPQGSGKSTQAKMLAENLNIPYIEMGQLLRDKMNANDQDAIEIRKDMQTGNLVPNEITVRTLNQRIAEHDCQNGFILDGYPRNEVQIQKLPEGIDKVLYINIPDEEAISRLSKRERTDDTPKLIKTRLDVFHSETEPLLSYFKEKGILAEIDGSGSIDKVQEEIRKLVKDETNKN